MPTASHILDDLTLVTAVDSEYVHKLKCSWPTWMKFRPELKQIPVLIIHDSRFDPRPDLAEILADHPAIRFISWELDEAESQRERMLTAFVKVPGEHVKSTWYLKLDADVVATEQHPLINPDWFQCDEQGRKPVYVSSPWSYTKPADAIAKLDAWADGIPAFQGLPRLDIPYDPLHSLVKHPRIASWCFIGNTQWTKEMADLTSRRLPVPSQDTFLFYCAARRGDHTARVRMNKLGMTPVARLRTLQRLCRAAMQLRSEPHALVSELAGPEPTSRAMEQQGVLYFLSGTSHAVRLLVSIWSLRKHFDGPVTILSTDSHAGTICAMLAADPRLNVTHTHLSDIQLRKRNSAYLFKPQLPRYSPYQITTVLDADTVIQGDISPLFQFPGPDYFIATQFTDWKSSGRTIAKRIRSWSGTHPELIEPALSFGPAVNSGVFSFTRDSALLKTWETVANQGKRNFIPDELALQLVLPHFPHRVLDGRFNCSSRYGAPNDSDTRIVHFHGDKHLGRNSDIWLKSYREVELLDLARIRQWPHAGDERLQAQLLMDTSSNIE